MHTLELCSWCVGVALAVLALLVVGLATASVMIILKTNRQISELEALRHRPKRLHKSEPAAEEPL